MLHPVIKPFPIRIVDSAAFPVIYSPEKKKKESNFISPRASKTPSSFNNNKILFRLPFSPSTCLVIMVIMRRMLFQVLIYCFLQMNSLRTKLFITFFSRYLFSLLLFLVYVAISSAKLSRSAIEAESRIRFV